MYLTNKSCFFYFKNLQNDESNLFYSDTSYLKKFMHKFEEHFIHINILNLLSSLQVLPIVYKNVLLILKYKNK